MATSPLPVWIARSDLREDRPDPYICLHFVAIYVRDQQRSLQFYVEKLGFIVVVDHIFSTGDRWIEVAPQDGTANLALVAPKPDSEDYKLIGRPTNIFFLTEDLMAKYHEWKDRGVQFAFTPQEPAWGGIYTRFEDIDGNAFGLAGFDEFRQGIEAQRRSVAQQRESERRAAQELEIATQIQGRLFPQLHPELKTLEYSGICIPARQVGGDYYDFLNLGRDRVGLVIGDISGKGMGAALLMANLQANLRGQSAIALDDPEGFLRRANRLFYENTSSNVYASLLYAEYDDERRSLRYTNCGHLPGLLVRRDNTVERLSPTATLLGLFENWECASSECQLVSGDILLLYTDGVTEAFNAQEEDFGEDRLIETVLRCRELPPASILGSIVDEVRQFSHSEQRDDITLLAAKCRNASES